MDTVIRVVTVVAFASAVVFDVLYHLRARWWRSAGGRHVMSWMAVTTLLLGLSSARALWGDYPGRRLIVAIALVGLVWVIWWRTWLLLKAQRDGRTRGN